MLGRFPQDATAIRNLGNAVRANLLLSLTGCKCQVPLSQPTRLKAEVISPRSPQLA